MVKYGIAVAIGIASDEDEVAKMARSRTQRPRDENERISCGISAVKAGVCGALGAHPLAIGHEAPQPT